MEIPCALCERPMQVAEGQLAFAHKACRKEARKQGMKEAIRSSEKRFETEQRLKAVQAVIHNS